MGLTILMHKGAKPNRITSVRICGDQMYLQRDTIFPQQVLLPATYVELNKTTVLCRLLSFTNTPPMAPQHLVQSAPLSLHWRGKFFIQMCDRKWVDIEFDNKYLKYVTFCLLVN